MRCTVDMKHPIYIVTWRILRYFRISESGFLLWNPLYWQPGGESFTSAFRVTRILVLFTYFCWYFSFSCERKLFGEHKARRRTAFQLASFPALSVRRLIVGRFDIATTQPPTSAEDHCLQLGPSAEATYSFNCHSELNNWSNFACILPLPLVKLH